MLSGRADAPDTTLLRALAAAQLDAATRPTISFLHVSAAGIANSRAVYSLSFASRAPPSATAADPTQEPAVAPRRGKKPRKKKARGARSAPAG